MRVESDYRASQPISRAADSSRLKRAVLNATFAGCLEAAGWATANAIGLHPGLLTLGIGLGFGEDFEQKANEVAINSFVFLAQGAVSGNWEKSIFDVAALITGVVGAEGINAIWDIDSIARRNLGIGISAGAAIPMIMHLLAGGGSVSAPAGLKTAALVATAITFALSYYGEQTSAKYRQMDRSDSLSRDFPDHLPCPSA